MQTAKCGVRTIRISARGAGHGCHSDRDSKIHAEYFSGAISPCGRSLLESQEIRPLQRECVCESLRRWCGFQPATQPVFRLCCFFLTNADFVDEVVMR